MLTILSFSLEPLESERYIQCTCSTITLSVVICYWLNDSCVHGIGHSPHTVSHNKPFEHLTCTNFVLVVCDSERKINSITRTKQPGHGEH